MKAKRMKEKEDEEYEKPRKKTTKKKKKRHLFLKTVIVLLIIIVILAGVLVGYVYSKFAKLNHEEIDVNDVGINVDAPEYKGYLNILLLGVDSRNNTYEGTLSDSIMIVSINQDTNDVKIASVYRDCYLKVGNKLDKITHAFGQGGAKASLTAINTNLDLDITKYVAINFEVVVDVVDAVGGIDMDITSAEAKYINTYIKEINRVTKHSSKQITKAGSYHLDGVQALAYARIRYTEGGDYKRTERQRTVLNKVFEKVKTMNLVQLNNIADKILGEISTNIPTNEILYLLSQAASYNIASTRGWPDTETGIKGYHPADLWYGAPVNLANQVKELHSYLFEEEEYETSATVQSISDQITKVTGYK